MASSGWLGIPLWGWGIAAGGAGLLVYRSEEKKKQTATAAAVAAQSSAATQAQQASTPQSPGSDPTLLAYQAGEASGVAGYSAGVSTGISLVDSIMGMFASPGGTSAGGTGTATGVGGGGGTGTGSTGTGSTGTSTPSPTAPTNPNATVSIGGHTYDWLSTPAAVSAAKSVGDAIYYYNPNVPGVIAPSNAKTLAAYTADPGSGEYIQAS